jgi:hypothetical protein
VAVDVVPAEMVLRRAQWARLSPFSRDRSRARALEAIEVIEDKRAKDGRWPLQNRHPGKERFAMDEGSGKPSRWNTLCALRVLRRYREA